MQYFKNFSAPNVTLPCFSVSVVPISLLVYAFNNFMLYEFPALTHVTLLQYFQLLFFKNVKIDILSNL